jgi:putative ABC transport system permease protein
MQGIFRSILRIWAILIVAIKRMAAQRGLFLATLLGLVAAISLVLSIPIYSEAVYYRVLSEGLFSDAPTFRGEVTRPPVALLFRYTGSFTGPTQWENMQPLDTYFRQQVEKDLKLTTSPILVGTRIFSTGIFGFFLEKDEDVVTEKFPEFQVALSTLGNHNTHVSIIEGRYPVFSGNTNEPIEVAVSSLIADKMGLQIDELAIVYDLRALHKYEDNPAKIYLRITGIWEPADGKAEFWEYNQFPADKVLLVDEQTFAQRISPLLQDEIFQALWYMPMNAEEIYVDDVPPLLLNLKLLDRRVDELLPGTKSYISPVTILEKYLASAELLNVLLFTFSIPIINLVLTFIFLVVTLTIENQRNQVAALRSRGGTRLQIVGITALESGITGLLALAISIPVSMALAYTIGQTRSFLDFSLTTDMRIGMTWATARYGILAFIIMIAAQTLPVIGSARYTIVTYKMERARRMRPPWWQRTGIDFILLLPAAYGMYILQQRGSLLQGTENDITGILNDPLLFLVPALSLVALALLVLRFLPLLMRLLGWISSLTRSVGFLMASRQLARAPGLYSAPLALLILTLGLSTYTASLAATLDSHLYDQQHYRTGADMSLVDTGEIVGGATGELGMVSSDPPQWRFIPASEYIKIPGITAATRIGIYEGLVRTSEGFIDGTFMGVDRSDFAGIAFWRDDFADSSLGEMMNELAVDYGGVLLPREFMTQHYFNAGDMVDVAVRSFGQYTTMRVKILGGFDFFPTWYPETGPLIVGNLDYFFQEAQGQFPYRVWFKTEKEINVLHLRDEVWEINLGAEALLSTSKRILDEQRKPERQGLLGLLSVGFSAAAILTALGFMLYALFSFRRRSIELGVLRAAGLSSQHLIAYVAWELIFLLVIGIAAGTGLGIWASKTFVPYMRLDTGMMTSVPPLVVEIAWPALFRIYALFGGLFLVALVILVRLMLRMKLFQVIKLGETV